MPDEGFSETVSIKLYFRDGSQYEFMPVRYDGKPHSFPYHARYHDNLVIRYEFNDVLHGAWLVQELEEGLVPKLGGYMQISHVAGVVLIEINLDGVEGIV